jgi:predicted nucleic acid-binding protein
MALIFLDTNILIDLYDRNPKLLNIITGHDNQISSLSCHILCYTNKIRIPNSKLNHLLADIGIIGLTSTIVTRSMQGPTDDFEDNVQLHSAAEANCQYFMTSDKLLLKMKFFGTTAIVSSL